MSVTYLSGTGLQTEECVHRDPGSSGRDDGGLLEDAVGAELYHHRHALQAQRDGQGMLPNLTLVERQEVAMAKYNFL